MRLERGLYTSVPWGHMSRHWWGGWWVCDKDQDESEATMLGSPPWECPGVGMVSGWRSVAVFSEVSLNTMVKTC